jgi:hypothetical protein
MFRPTQTGRFSSPDQPFIDWNLSNPQSFNLYSYVLNDPLSFIDPTGQDCVQSGLLLSLLRLCQVQRYPIG